MIKNDPRMRTGDAYAGSAVSDADDLSGRIADRLALEPVASEESLVVDDRSAMRPAQAVEHKLSRMLMGGAMPISHLQSRAILRAR